MEIPEQFKYTVDHGWVFDNKKSITFGVTDFFIKDLGKLLFLDLPRVGDEILSGISFGEIESLDNLIDIVLPINAEVIAVNERLYENLEILSSDPYGRGWLIKFVTEDIHLFDELLNAREYAECISKYKASSKQKNQRKSIKVKKGKK
ncbi:MAG: glycine cleavage system protein H [Candidatus Kuenenia sp.]|nr:glycine cleavage system protein H [Candidatus Kuenenia hertensis]